MSKPGTVYLIPSLLDDNASEIFPAYIIEAIKKCKTFFVENERTSRRFLKKIFPSIIIDDYEWINIHKTENEAISVFRNKLKMGESLGIISEAGCPGIADPGQKLIAAAQDMNASVKPLVGPSSILLALMASGLNGQQFRFLGYLPIENSKRISSIREMETESKKRNTTQIFIETPYRNNQLLESLLAICSPSTKLCIASNLTSTKESVKTKSIAGWKKNKPDLHKQPVVFCLLA